MSKGLFVFLACMSISAAAQAATFSCKGTEYTKGEATLRVEGKRLTISGQYHTQVEGEKPSDTIKAECSGHLANGGQAGLKQHDYYTISEGCGADYIRTSKDLESRKVGWIDLVTRGPSDHDAPGYGYANFRCAQ